MAKKEPKLIDVYGPVEVRQVGWRPRYFEYVCTAPCTDPMGRVNPNGNLGIVLEWASAHARVAHDWEEVPG